MGKRVRNSKKPRILVVTPEITYLPAGMGNMANHLNAKAGGLADVSASLVAALFDHGADVHVALPHYRRMFHMDVGRLISDELRVCPSLRNTAQLMPVSPASLMNLRHTKSAALSPVSITNFSPGPTNSFGSRPSAYL